METGDLQHDIACFIDLHADLVASDEKEPIRSNSISYVEAFLDRAASEVERRYALAKRSTLTPAGDRWRFHSRYDDMKELAQELKRRLPVALYLERYVPWADLTPQGERLRGRCPFPGHADWTASFVVFPDDHAWCFGCQQGGDLFRVVALIEGLPVFRDQLQYVADLVEPRAQEVG